MPNIYVPRGYSETDDLFAALVVYAPDMSSYRMTLDEAFEKLLVGIDSVLAKPKNLKAHELLTEVKADVIDSHRRFSRATTPDAVLEQRKHLQSVYYDKFRAVPSLLKKGRTAEDFGPDDSY